MPSSPDALTADLDGIAELLADGDAALAAERARRLQENFPHSIEAARFHGIALLHLGRNAEARLTLEAAHRNAPDSVEVLCNLGSAALACGDAGAAVDALEKAHALAPSHPATLNGLGTARRASGDMQGARDAYAASARFAPGYTAAWLNLAASELALGAIADADSHVRQALGIEPTLAEGWLLLGHVLAAQQHFAQAGIAYAKGGQLAPQDARFAYQVGLMAEEQHHLGQAAAAHARAIALAPDRCAALGQLAFVKRRLCDWENLPAISARLRECIANGAPDIGPFGLLAEPLSPAEQLHAAVNAARHVEAAVAPERARLDFRHARLPADAPLRVGFVSNGFGEHPTGLLMVALIEALQTSAIEVHLFASEADDGCSISQRLHRACQWHDIAGLPAAAAAAKVRTAQIEILVDLGVWAAGGMTELFALRPAPLQVNWLAYPGTSGAPWMDYVMADRIVLPDAERANFSEQVAWLPRCFQPSDSTRRVGTPPPRAECGLPETGMVYVCFNNSYKLNRASMERMFAVLRGVPGSVLWLLSGPEDAGRRLREFARSKSIDPARLVFMPKLPHGDYLARYRHAGLFLDTTPYNAHTTASDALWAGCPLLTVAGDTFASRVAASLNHHLGMDAMNAPDDSAFIDLAVKIGRDPELRVRLHADLASRKVDHGLFDMQGYAKDFSSLLLRMAARHRSGQSPAHLD